MGFRIEGRWRVIEVIFAMALAIAGPVPAFASETHRFDVPAEDATSAIRDFASQAHVQILVAGENVTEKHLHAVSGELSTDQGLRLLLADSGLTPQYVGDRSIALVTSSSPNSPPPATSDSAKAEKKSIWDSFRVAQVDPRSTQVPGRSLDTKGRQDPSAAGQQGEQLQEVTVTGTHIRGVDLSPVANIQTLDRAQVQQSGATQVSDLINEIPSNTGTTLYNETGQLTGTAQFELRGLGFSSTLTLVNGRRAGVAPLSDKSGADFVDINQFPLSMVGRVDVLKDGASAIYGSEAVAGVVNIITRKVDGWEVNADYADSTNHAYTLNIATGHQSDRGSIDLFVTYYNQTGNVRSDFDWLIDRIGGGGVLGRSQLLSGNGYPGTYSLAATNAAGKPVVAPGATTVPDPNCQAAGGVFAISNTGIPNQSTCDFNFEDQIGVIPAESRVQSFVQGDYKLNDHLSYFNETSLSRNLNQIFKQPGGYSNGSVAGGNIYVPANAPFNFFIADPANPKNIVYVNPAQWNPAVDQAVAVAGNFRPQGPYYSGEKEQTDTYLRFVNGLDLALAHDWHITASDEYAYAEFEENDPVRINATALNSLIAIGQYNPFASSIVTPTLVSPKNGTSVAANSASVINQLFYTSTTTRRTDQQVVDLSASGPTFSPPTGSIAVAVGGQYRIQRLRYIPDSLSAEGLADSPATDAPFSGTERVWAEYAEAIIPVYQLAQVQAAVRREDYGGGIGSSTNPKITARLNAVPGILALRASWGTSFQAPTLTQNATSQAFVIINDPVIEGPNGLACSTSSLGNNVNVITSGGNLKPQTSENYNMGFDFNPLSALTFTGDFWHYDYANLIAAGQNGQSIVNGECVNGVFVNDPRAVRGASGQLFGVNTAYVNVGKVVADGIDLSSTYHASLGAFGELAFRGDATFVKDFNVYGANGSVQHDAGNRNFNNNFAPMPHWRATARGVWSKDIQEASLAVHYTEGYTNDQSGYAPISSFTTVDLQYQLRMSGLIGSGPSELRLGVKNVFDTAPPALIRYNAAGQLVTGTVSNIDRPGYDPLSGAGIPGRILYVHLSQNF
jgi:iron complex outermembrane receptor protein